MLIDNYEFEGPFVSKQMIRAEPGVYVILDGLSLSRPKVIYVGQSMSLRNRVAHHEQESYWRQYAPLGFYYAVYYTHGLTEYQRRQIELQIIRKYNPPCNNLGRLKHYDLR